MKSIFTSILVMAFAFSSCISDNTGERICTDEFVIHNIIVLQPNEQPADSVNIAVRNAENGEVYEICQDNLCDSNGYQGRYIIFHDGFQGEISKKQENLVVSGSKDSLNFTEEYAFYDDGCHVRKLAGPDTVRLR